MRERKRGDDLALKWKWSTEWGSGAVRREYRGFMIESGPSDQQTGGARDRPLINDPFYVSLKCSFLFFKGCKFDNHGVGPSNLVFFVFIFLKYFHSNSCKIRLFYFSFLK